MKRNFLRGISRIVFFALVPGLIIACRGSSTKDCLVEYKVAQAHFSSYYRTKDSLELIVALKTLDGAGNCQEYRRRMNALKISVLFLLQRYKQVAIFIDSCSPGDFSKPYQKSFSKNFALAKSFERGKDFKNRDSLLLKNLGLVSDFLRSTDRSSLDTTAVYDYFYTESQFLPKEKFLSGIDSAERDHPADSALFTAFRASFYPSAATKPGVKQTRPNTP